MPTEAEPSYGGSEWNFIICGTEYRKMSVYEHLLPKPAMRRKTAIRSTCRTVAGVDLDEQRNLNPTGRTWFLVERALDALIREKKVDQPKKGMLRAVQPDPGQIMDVEWLFCIRKVRGRSKMTRDEVVKRALEVAKQYYGVQVDDGEVPSGLMEVVKNVSERIR